MKNIYTTKDFYLACSLVSNGFSLVGSHTKNGKSVFFEIQYTDKEKLDEILSSFIDMDLCVNVKNFTHSMKLVRKELDKYRI